MVSSESTEFGFFNPKAMPLDIVPPAVKPVQDYLERKTGAIE